MEKTATNLWAKALRVVMALALVMGTAAVGALVPREASAVGEDAGSWSMKIYGYSIDGAEDDLNGGLGYKSEDGDTAYCYDWESHGPGSDGAEYTHMKRGSNATDYVVAMGYPNKTKIEGHSLTKAQAQQATQLAAWIVSGTMSVDPDERYAATSSEVRKAAKDLAAAAQAYEGGDELIDGASSIVFVDGKREVQAMLLGNMFGHLSLKKTSSIPQTSKGNALYDLSKVQYSVYTDKDCTQSYRGYKLTMNAEHNAGLDLVPGTYYVKETSAGTDSYAVNSTVYKAVVKSGKTTAVGGGEVTDVPKSGLIDIVVKKLDSESQSAEPQGDGSLAGAVFTVEHFANVDGKTGGKALRTWRLSTDEEGHAKLDDSHLVGGDELYRASDGTPCLALGTYLVKETSAPEGYLVNGEEHVIVVTADSGSEEHSVTVSMESGDTEDGTAATDDDVIRGGVQVTKLDKELGASEALEGSGHAEAQGSHPGLDGIEFTITNQSAHKVRVDGEWREPGETAAVITTAWNEEAGAYTAQTSSDALPYGTYSIQETKTNDSYLLTDGEAKTFQIREDGETVKAAADGSELSFENQVVRNDLEVYKKAESTNASLQVPFVIENVSTGEKHVLVTDRNGNASTASSWNKHSSNTNGNDALMEAEAITSSDMDAKAGVWFSLGEDGSTAPVDDALAALPYGEYTLTELRCEANEGLELVKKTFWVERDSTAAKAIVANIDDQDGPEIGTSAADKADGDRTAQAGGETTIVDTVSYRNLKPGTEYTVHGTLHVKATDEEGEVSDGGELTDAEGNAVSAEATFTPTAADGTIELEFTFDSSLLAGEDVVAFESLRTDGLEVSAHADISDGDQTVHFLDIGTTASDAADGDKLVTGSDVTVSDAVACTGLVPGERYRLEATLVDAETGEALTDAQGGAVTGTAEFTAEEADEEHAVELKLDASGLGGKRLVVFEKLFSGDMELANHEDATDEGQTVTVVEIGTKATDAADGDQTIEAGKVTVSDTVSYAGLVPGETYTMSGTLMDKSTGKALLDADGEEVTAETEFTPDEASGTVEVTFEFDASGLSDGSQLVAFERCLDAEGKVVASHEDLDDEGQTVTVEVPEAPETPGEAETPEGGESYDKTGSSALPLIVGAAVALVAGGACTAYGLARRKKRAEADTSDAGEVE